MVSESLGAADGAGKPDLDVGRLLVEHVLTAVAHLDVQHPVCVVDVVKHGVLRLVEGICQVLRHTIPVSCQIEYLQRAVFRPKLEISLRRLLWREPAWSKQ